MSRPLTSILILAALLAGSTTALAQSPPQCFLGASTSRYGDGARIQGNVGTNDAGGLLQLGRRSVVEAGSVASGDTVRLGPGSQIASAAANVLDKTKATVGQEGAVSLPLTDPFCPVPAFACGGQEVVVRKNKTLELPPGSYGSVVLQNGADLVLGAGTYEFCSLEGGRNTAVVTSGETVLNVQGAFEMGNGSRLGPDGGAPQAVVNVGGGATKLGAKSRVAAALAAPAAALDLGRGVEWRGAFCASSVTGGRRLKLDCAAPPATTTTTSTSTTTTSTTSTTGPTTTTTTTSTTSTTGPTTTTTTTSTTSTTGPTTTTTTTSTTSTTGPTTTTTTTSTTSTTGPTTTTTTTSTTSTTGPTTTTTTTSTTSTTGPTTTTTSSTSTTAPTTTSTTAPTTTTTTTSTTTSTTGPTTTTTTTTSTTTTTVPGPVTCGPSNFLDVTATLVYEPRIVGGVFGMFLEVDYPVGVTIPGSGTAASARARFTNLIGANYRFVPQDLDTNANGVDDQGRSLVTANTAVEIPAAAIERIRFDCPSGTVVQPAQFACRPTALSDSAGILLPPEVAALVSCSLGFAVP